MCRFYPDLPSVNDPCYVCPIPEPTHSDIPLTIAEEDFDNVDIDDDSYDPDHEPEPISLDTGLVRQPDTYISS